MSEKHKFLNKDLASAEGMKNVHGLTLEELAIIYDCSPKSLKVALSRYRKGKREPYWERLAEEQAEIKRRVARGERNVDIARALNVVKSSVSHRRKRIGIPAQSQI